MRGLNALVKEMRHLTLDGLGALAAANVTFSAGATPGTAVETINPYPAGTLLDINNKPAVAPPLTFAPNPANPSVVAPVAPQPSTTPAGAPLGNGAYIPNYGFVAQLAPGSVIPSTYALPPDTVLPAGVTQAAPGTVTNVNNPLTDPNAPPSTPVPTTPSLTNPLQYVPSNNPLCDSVNADTQTATEAGCILYGSTNTSGYYTDANGNVIDPSTGQIVGTSTTTALDLSNPWLWAGGALLIILLMRKQK